ncbi:MAG: hypothetical protein HRT74_04510 [Flavobacteriales bacterium]|nr:hypothetical protein [Flavobacteriales bacterium]
MIFKRKKEYIAAFYNVENLFNTVDDEDNNDRDFTPEGRLNWTKEKYDLKISQLQKVIFNLGGKAGLPAFIGLSEVENLKVVEDLINTPLFKDQHYKIIHKDSSDTRGIDIAFVYNSKLFKVKGHEWHPFRRKTEHPLDGRDILEVFGSWGKQPFRFFINHWPSRRKGQEETEFKRVAASKVLKQAIDNHHSAKDAIIVMGDFNDEPSNVSLSMILGASENNANKRARVLVNLGWRYHKNKVGTIIHDNKPYLVDQFLISQNLRQGLPSGFKVKKMYIYRGKEVMDPDEPKKKPAIPWRTYRGPHYHGGVSDHFPVFIRIRKSE